MCFQPWPTFPPTRSLNPSRNQQNKLHRQEISSRHSQRSHISLPRSRRTKQDPRSPVVILQETTTTTTPSLTRGGSSRWSNPRAHHRPNLRKNRILTHLHRPWLPFIHIHRAVQSKQASSNIPFLQEIDS